MNVAPLFDIPFVLENILQLRNVLLVGARHDEIIDFTSDKNPTVGVEVLVDASFLIAALKSTTGQWLIQEFIEQLRALAQSIQCLSQEYYETAVAFVVFKGNTFRETQERPGVEITLTESVGNIGVQYTCIVVDGD